MKELIIGCDTTNILFARGQLTGKLDINGNHVKLGDRVEYISRVRYDTYAYTEIIGGREILRENSRLRTETGTIVYRKYRFCIDMDNYSYEDERYYSLNQRNLKVIK